MIQRLLGMVIGCQRLSAECFTVYEGYNDKGTENWLNEDGHG